MTHQERLAVFDKLRAKHLRFLTGVLWKLTGDRELFAEAMQDTLLGMWRHLEKLGRKDSPGYLYRIALSANAKAWRRRIGHNGQAPPGWADSRAEFVPPPDRTELYLAVRQAIVGLPDKQGRAVVMRYLEQQDYEAIAAALGCSEATARSHVSKAIAALKSQLVLRKWDWDDGEEQSE
jgi:RNA polymerase sigma factor (sigma-70 family)